MSKRLTLRIPDDLHARLQHAAEHGGFGSACGLARAVLVQYLRLPDRRTTGGWTALLRRPADSFETPEDRESCEMTERERKEINERR